MCGGADGESGFHNTLLRMRGGVLPENIWGSNWTQGDWPSGQNPDGLVGDQVKELEVKSQIMAGINPIGFKPLKLYMLKKYVDNCLVVLETMKLGVRWASWRESFYTGSSRSQ